MFVYALLAAGPLGSAAAQEAEAAPVAAGDRHRIALSERFEGEHTFAAGTDPDTPTDTIEQRWTMEARILEEVTAVEEDRATGWRWTFDDWTWSDLREGGATSRDLAGRVVVFAARPNGRVGWTLEVAPEEEPPELSPPARAFLDAWTRRWSPDGLAGLLAGGEEPAQVEAERAARALVPEGERVDVDPEASRVSVEGAVDPGSGSRVELEADLQLATLPGADAPISEGGRCRATLRGSWGAGRGPWRGDLRLEARFAGEAVGRRPDGAEYRLGSRFERELEVEVTPEG